MRYGIFIEFGVD